MKDLEKAAIEKQKLFKRLLTVAVKQIIYGGVSIETVEPELLSRFGPAVVNIVHPVLVEAATRDREAPVYYCGRCMRFFTIDNFNETNSVKAISGEGGYCLQCGSQKLEVMVDFASGTVEYIETQQIRAEKQDQNGIPLEVKQWTQDPSTENLVKAILSVQKIEEKPLYFFEIVVTTDQIDPVQQFLSLQSVSTTMIRTQDHAIISGVLHRELTEHEVGLFRNIGRSFVTRMIQFQ